MTRRRRCSAVALETIRCELPAGHRGPHEAVGKTGITLHWPADSWNQEPTDEEYADATPGGMPPAVKRGARRR